MARDNSPKERQLNKLERKQNQRASYDRILIVTEGRKTEPTYFADIRDFYRLHTANVCILPSEFGTCPLRIVEHAEHLFLNGSRNGLIQPRRFEKIYAVFDRDDHVHYRRAINKAEALNQKLRNDEKQRVLFQAIVSVPSFELWFLLHFKEIFAPIHRNEVLTILKQYLPDYQKGATGTFNATRPKLQTAIDRARILAGRFNARTDPEPFTDVFRLVETLVALKRP